MLSRHVSECGMSAADTEGVGGTFPEENKTILYWSWCWSFMLRLQRTKKCDVYVSRVDDRPITSLLTNLGWGKNNNYMNICVCVCVSKRSLLFQK